MARAAREADHAQGKASALSAATLPRLASLVRTLLQVRLMLAACALLLLPSERLVPPTVAAILAYALLSGLVAWNWERFVPYLLNHPLLVTLDVFVATGILAIDGPSGAAFLTTIITAAIAGALFGWRGMAAVSLLQILGYAAAMASYISVHGGEGAVEVMSFQVLLVHPLLYPLVGYVGMRVRALLTELAGEQEARRNAERAAAAAEERSRLARDMHDSVSKTLRGAAMAAQALPLWVAKDPERAAATAAQVAEAAELAALEARELIAGLRDGSAVGPFPHVVSEIVREWSATSGTPAEVRDHAGGLEPTVGARQESLAILKEALANVERHAEAASVTVEIEADAGYCVLAVADDGKGFTTDPDTVRSAEAAGNGHYGLLGMSERAQRVGGTVSIDSAPDRGTQLRVRVPAVSNTPDDTQGVPQ